MTSPAVYLDRDGVLTVLVPDESTGVLESPLRPEDVVLLPGVAQAARALARAGFVLVGVTNQPAAAKQTVSVDVLETVQTRSSSCSRPRASSSTRGGSAFTTPEGPTPCSAGPANAESLLPACCCRRQRSSASTSPDPGWSATRTPTCSPDGPQVVRHCSSRTRKVRTKDPGPSRPTGARGTSHKPYQSCSMARATASIAPGAGQDHDADLRRRRQPRRAFSSSPTTPGSPDSRRIRR